MISAETMMVSVVALASRTADRCAHARFGVIDQRWGR
jgi:hypothetical protein